MGRFHGPSAKRHRVWSNDKLLLQRLSVRAGSLKMADREGLTSLTHRYVDRNGVPRCVGLKKKLKESQPISQDPISKLFVALRPLHLPAQVLHL